jgi:hypothetical protein
VTFDYDVTVSDDCLKVDIGSHGLEELSLSTLQALSTLFDSDDISFQVTRGWYGEPDEVELMIRNPKFD